MNILITGASGYLGARLSSFLKQHHPEHELILASRSGRCSWLNGLGKQIAMDLENNKIQLPENIDAVVHLAALNELDCVDVKRALKVNVDGTWALIEAAVTGKVSRFVYASTIHVYGPLEGQLTEDSLPRGHHPYGFTHAMGEQIFQYATNKYGVAATCLRFSNIVGSPVDKQVNRWSLLVNDLCQQAIELGKLTLKSPDSLRDFIGMTDACLAVEKALNNSGKSFEVFNISRGSNVKVRDVAELIAKRAEKLLGKQIEIVLPNSSSATQQPIFSLDATKAKKWGWSASSEIDWEIDATLLLCMKDSHVTKS